MPGSRGDAARREHRGGGRKELRAAAVLLAAVVVLSVFAGAVWGLLAPTELVLVVEPGRGATLVGESLHRFDALAIFAGLGAVTGVLSAAAAWRWRRMRGPIQLIGLLLGSVAGAWVMAWVGETINDWDNPRPGDPPVGQIVSLPVGLESPLALLVQPLTAALVILLLAGLSTTEDLGSGFMSPFGESRPQPYAEPEYPDYDQAFYPGEPSARVPVHGTAEPGAQVPAGGEAALSPQESPPGPSLSK
ncbi:DUF2567 domain-containing protein [Nocardia speluncae]|uniref:DUF2567 domain-containing protein n=1 Tax=Nocardia speluncae TaxID=419477 RepID=UPI00082F4871|nr:DUF2567 domain-containing protein [Nocardia speluncae]